MAIDPNLITTASVGELPAAPPLLMSLLAHETVSDNLLKQMTIQQLVDLIAPLVSAIQYQIITLHVDSTYIEDNFDASGLGINLMAGYAICNGNNGTINKDGRVGIAYGATYNVVGAIGGSTDAVVVSHSHTYNSLNNIGKEVLGFDAVGNKEGASYFISNTNTVGVSGTNKNMQPYLVELQIMKL